MFSHILHIIWTCAVSVREDLKIISPAEARILTDLEKMGFFFYCRGPHKYNSCKVSVHKTQWFQRRKWKCEMFTDRRTANGHQMSKKKSRFELSPNILTRQDYKIKYHTHTPIIIRPFVTGTLWNTRDSIGACFHSF